MGVWIRRSSQMRVFAWVFVVAAVSVTGLWTASATAAALVINQEIDISGVTVANVPGNGQSVQGPFVGGSPITVTAGDTIDVTYTFADGYRIRMSDPDFGTSDQERISAWGLLDTSASATNFSVSNISVDLLGVTATPGTTTSFTGTTQSGGSGNLGPIFIADDIIPTGGQIEFSGVTGSFSVDSLTTNPQVYDGVFLFFRSPQLEIIVPEPTTGGIVLLAVAGACLKRRRLGGSPCPMPGGPDA